MSISKNGQKHGDYKLFMTTGATVAATALTFIFADCLDKPLFFTNIKTVLYDKGQTKENQEGTI